jgi:hypothetical protein
MSRNKTYLCIGGALLVTSSPLLLIAAILLEVLIFRTRYISDFAESIGLTPFLQKVFTSLGING